jgi:hypothetical protein
MARVEPYAHLKGNTAVLLDLFSIPFYVLLYVQGRVAGSSGVVFMGYRCAEQGHHSISGELVDGAFIPVYLIHEDLEASVHDLVDFFGIELFGKGCKICRIRKKHGDQFTFTFNGASGSQDLIGQVFGGVGLGLSVVDRWGFLGF